MRFIVVILLTVIVAGCQGSPPKPAECEGDFRPINLPPAANTHLSRAESEALCSGMGSTNG